MSLASARHFNTLEAHFGPPSEPIDLASFLSSQTLPCPEECPADEDFQVDDIRVPANKIWDNPELSAYLLKHHNLAMDAFFRSTKPSAAPPRKLAIDDKEPNVATLDLIACLDNIGITSYKYPPETAFFTRAPKHQDQNTLRKIKVTPDGEATNPDNGEAIITISIYWKGSHSSPVRTSQHALLSSQTLGDLYEVFPCSSKDLPVRVNDTTYEYKEDVSSSGAAILIDRVLYGDGMNETDYADKILHHLSKKKTDHGLTKSPKSMFDVSFTALALRTQEPYWIIHQGNCEHFAVIDQIRLRHPSDLKGGYPLTLQITPLPVDLCRACCRVAAAWSVVADDRLGESPCLLCGPCWRSMGDPPAATNVVVVPLPRFQIGW